MDLRHYNPKKLIDLREEKKWTQDFVAEQLNVSRETISRIETGKNASYEILCGYSGLVDIDVTQILHPRPVTSAI